MKSPSGFEVLIGKNARENEYMSTHLLAGNDYWFHAKGVPGPHVILKVPKGVVPDTLDISFASKFAKNRSKRRTPGRLPMSHFILRRTRYMRLTTADPSLTRSRKPDRRHWPSPSYSCILCVSTQDHY